MKSKNLLCLLAVTMSLSSCQTINRLVGQNPIKNTIVTQKNNVKKSFGLFQSKGRGKKVAAQDDEIVAETANEPETTSSQRTFAKTDSLRAVHRLAGEWYFDTVGGITVTGEENRPTLEFDENTTRFYATNGCDYFNGRYRLTDFKTITFDDVVGTLQDCHGPDWEPLISVMWDKVMYWDYRGGTEKQLTLKDSSSRVLATLKRHALENFNGLWRVAEINGRTPDGEPLVMVVDLRERHVHGNTGCNLFNGTIYQDPDSEGSVQFQDMTVSKLNCDNRANETTFLVALEQVEHVKLVGQDTAILSDAADREILKLKRSDN